MFLLETGKIAFAGFFPKYFAGRDSAGFFAGLIPHPKNPA
jgi:hypothetical protein